MSTVVDISVLRVKFHCMTFSLEKFTFGDERVENLSCESVNTFYTNWDVNSGLRYSNEGFITVYTAYLFIYLFIQT